MADPRNTLKSKFDITSRFNNYGSVIVRVVIKGFRCHKNTIIDVRSPIVAFCGMNGTGKSTILQVLSTAYHATGPNWRTFYMRDFFLK